MRTEHATTLAATNAQNPYVLRRDGQQKAAELGLLAAGQLILSLYYRCV
jgi:hypothetical protein